MAAVSSSLASLASSSSSFLPISPYAAAAGAGAAHARDNFKLASWRCSNSQNYGILRLCNVRGNSGQSLQSYVKLKRGVLTRQIIPSALPEGQTALTETTLDTIESNNLHFIGEHDSSSPKCSSCPYEERTIGKPGFISFHGIPKRKDEIVGSSQNEGKSKVLWYLGPTVLVGFLVLPSLYLRKIFSRLFVDSLLTDFLILFFTEALFYTGVAVFIGLVDFVWKPIQKIEPSNSYIMKTQYALQISSAATFVLSLIIPLLTMGMVWPWTGPAASATLAPYLVGLVVQFAFEQYARYKRSSAWTLIPIVFQVYRLHQLNRAAQLVQALYVSVRGANTTAQTVAINNSLWTLLIVLQILGVICIWSLASFLMRFLPPQVVPEP